MRDRIASYFNYSYYYIYRVFSPSGPFIAWRRALIGIRGYILYLLPLLCSLLLDGEDIILLLVSTDGKMFEGSASYAIISYYVFPLANIPLSF
jgi:hypothetical protein